MSSEQGKLERILKRKGACLFLLIRWIRWKKPCTCYCYTLLR